MMTARVLFSFMPSMVGAARPDNQTGIRLALAGPRCVAAGSVR
ncbi:hypothetical protein [Actinocatenispora sera]|nr:hypothetical protein [Actinocatenispora sera]